ncbi:MAG: hypothetical protein CL879_13035 [Dehalococcoidia bacterium]|nr:hypothetical protein [Dehalococcoidia bacterium]
MPDRPNIVFMLPEQLRPDFLNYYGADFINTPNIDWVANDGNRYDRAYSASSLCIQARTALPISMVSMLISTGYIWIRYY